MEEFKYYKIYNFLGILTSFNFVNTLYSQLQVPCEIKGSPLFLKIKNKALIQFVIITF